MLSRYSAGARRAPSFVFVMAAFLSGCNAKSIGTSSIAIASTSISKSSNSSQQNSSINNATSSSSQSSSVVSSSSARTSSSVNGGGNVQNVIVPRTICPAPPKSLIANGGDWKAHHAVADYPAAEYDAVVMFKELMAAQKPIEHRGVVMQWSMHTPFQAAQNSDAKYPLVIFLHGGAEARIEGNGPGFLDNRHAKSFFASNNSLLTAANQERFPAYIVAPFCDGKATTGIKCSFGAAEWASNGYGAVNAQLNSDGSPFGGALEALIEQLIANKQVDPARVYVTGPSMGGGGSWDIAARRPDLIAATIPMAGHPLSDSALKILADHKVPVWSHHGAKDNTNSYQAAKSAIAALTNKGGCAWQTTYNPSSNLADDDSGDADASDAIHNIWARAYTNPELWPWVFAQAQPTKAVTTPTQPEIPNGGQIPSGEIVPGHNTYTAPKALTAPIIDGVMDAQWDKAPWMQMDVAWTNFGFERLTAPTSAQDYRGLYKAVWTPEHLYLLFDITDDVLHISGGGQAHQGDTVEIFLDEDQSGGEHEFNFNAFAYHISYTKNIEDGSSNIAGHVTAEIKTEGNRHLWEMKIEIYANHNGYSPSEKEAARITLSAGKIMGFTPSYIDNDNNNRQREHFMSSVDTPEHQANKGYISADGFGTLILSE